jgi:alpha-glucosidase
MAMELLAGASLSAPLVRGAVERAAGNACWALSGPEVARHATRLARAGGAEEPDRLAKFSFSLLASLPGAIGLYQGEELGLSDAGGAGGSLTPMVWDELGVYAGFSRARPWQPIPAPHRVRAVANEEYDPASVLAHYRNMLAFRRAHPVLRTGDAAFVDMPGEGLALVRSDGGERLLCLFNFGAEAERLPVPGAVRFLDAPGFGQPAVEAGKAIVLPPLAAAFGIVA